MAAAAAEAEWKARAFLLVAPSPYNQYHGRPRTHKQLHTDDEDDDDVSFRRPAPLPTSSSRVLLQSRVRQLRRAEWRQQQPQLAQRAAGTARMMSSSKPPRRLCDSSTTPAAPPPRASTPPAPSSLADSAVQRVANTARTAPRGLAPTAEPCVASSNHTAPRSSSSANSTSTFSAAPPPPDGGDVDGLFMSSSDEDDSCLQDAIEDLDAQREKRRLLDRQREEVWLQRLAQVSAEVREERKKAAEQEAVRRESEAEIRGSLHRLEQRFSAFAQSLERAQQQRREDRAKRRAQGERLRSAIKEEKEEHISPPLPVVRSLPDSPQQCSSPSAAVARRSYPSPASMEELRSKAKEEEEGECGNVAEEADEQDAEARCKRHRVRLLKRIYGCAQGEHEADGEADEQKR